MASISFDEETLPKLRPTSTGLLCGSRFATGIAETICKMESIGNSEFHPMAVDSFEALVEAVSDVLSLEVDNKPTITISPGDATQDEIASKVLRDTLGGLIEAQTSGFPNKLSAKEIQSIVEEVLLLPVDLIYSLPHEFGLHFVTNLIMAYLQSFPGDDAAAGNHWAHVAFRNVLSTRTARAEGLPDITSCVMYRLSIVAQANQYKTILGPSFEKEPGCHELDRQVAASQRASEINEARRMQIYHMVIQKGSDLFDRPPNDGDRPHPKGVQYLSSILAKSPLSLDDVASELDRLVQYKRDTSRINITVRTLDFLKRPKIRQLVEEVAKECEWRLREREEFMLAHA